MKLKITVKKTYHLSCCIGLLGFAVAISASDKDSESEDASINPTELVMVIGTQSNIKNMPGSAQLVTNDDIRQQNYDDVNKALNKVPGVYVREEDGFGLFSNISLRGVDTTRSAKVTMMEDGIMIAPAPYSAPAAYYTPTAGRMHGLEILKGSSQIKYGPHTTGGVINYLSTPIPRNRKFYLKSTFGSFNELRNHAYIGNTIDSKAGEFGLLLESFTRQNDGFKSIDETPDFTQGDETGFKKADATVKLSWRPNSSIYQLLEFKFGSSDLNANETYLGLSDEDFRINPNRRYAASRFDNIDSEQSQFSLRYSMSPNSYWDIVTTIYQTDYRRNWYKLQKINGENPSTVIATPGLSQDCMKGLAACDLTVRANNRRYSSDGIESVIFSRFNTGKIEHEIMFGIRQHKDDITRFQWENTYAQAENGTISAITAGIPGAAGDRYQRTDALAFFIQDTINAGNWSITPGVRYEILDQISEDPNGVLQSVGGSKGRDGKNSFNMKAFGIGFAYQFNQNWNGFAGIHTGFSPPNPRGTRSGLDPETSTAIELGLRYSNDSQSLAAEATLFRTVFKDLIVVDNIGGAGTGDSENFGEVLSQGFEFAIQYDAGLANNWTLSNPYYFSITYTDAIQQNDAQSTDPESIFSFGRKGNKVPYIPDLTFSLGTSLESERWGAFISGNYVSETFTSANNVNEQINGNGMPDVRFGKTDSYFILDLSGQYYLNDRVKLFAGIQNLLDETYIVSRQPDGLRGGMPQFFYTGIEIDFK
ncbi:MAG: TonB-dependent receptor [Proteobacteria bacterium]|nr:TonB-dependent receptor [Pseudomonadota bacterium]